MYIFIHLLDLSPLIRNIRSLSHILRLLRILGFIMKCNWQAQIVRHHIDWILNTIDLDLVGHTQFCWEPTQETDCVCFRVCGCGPVSYFTNNNWNWSKLRFTHVVHMVKYVYTHFYTCSNTHLQSRIQMYLHMFPNMLKHI